MYKTRDGRGRVLERSFRQDRDLEGGGKSHVWSSYKEYRSEDLPMEDKEDVKEEEVHEGEGMEIERPPRRSLREVFDDNIEDEFFGDRRRQLARFETMEDEFRRMRKDFDDMHKRMDRIFKESFSRFW